MNESEDHMDSSSTSKNTKNNESTVRSIGSKSVKISVNKLRYRRIQREATTDDKIEQLNALFKKKKLSDRSLKDTEDLQSIARDFLQQAVHNLNDSCYSYIDQFFYNFDEGKSKIDHPVVYRKYFEVNLKRCLTRNEAVLQRTIMIHIINQYWLGNILTETVKGNDFNRKILA